MRRQATPTLHLATPTLPPGHAYTPPGHAHNLPSHTLTSSSHAYSYPVLASDPTSIAKAGFDPRACRVDTDMVLLWKDIHILDGESGVSFKERLQGASLEAVMKDFVDVARNRQMNSDPGRHESPSDHNKLLSPTHGRHHGSRDFLQVSRPVFEPGQRLHVCSTELTGSRRPDTWHRQTKDIADKELTRGVPSSHTACAICALVDTETYGRRKHLRRSSSAYGGSDWQDNFADREHRSSSGNSYSDGLDTSDEYPDVFDDPSPTGTGTASTNQRHRSISSSYKVEVHCHHPGCRKAIEDGEDSYQNCPICHVVYCCWYCRKRDRKRHKRWACHGSRATKACKEVLQFSAANLGVGEFISRMARRGYMSSGRGCVMMGFVDLTSAKEFMRNGLAGLDMKPVYLTTKEMEASKMYCRTLDQLVDACSRYDPGTEFVVNAGVGVRWSRCPTPSTGKDVLEAGQQSPERKWSLCRSRSGSVDSDGGYESSVNHTADLESRDRNIVHHDCSLTRDMPPIVQRWAKLQLQRANVFLNSRKSSGGFQLDNTRYGPTLILTRTPGISDGGGGRRAREINFTSIQRKLRDRGVTLRHQFPRVYAALVKYVTDGDHFPGEIIFPVDTVHKKLFTCVLMPESEPDLEWTQSSGLLNDLDISKRCPWKSVITSPQLFSSPLCQPSDVSSTPQRHANLSQGRNKKAAASADSTIGRPGIVRSEPVTATSHSSTARLKPFTHLAVTRLAVTPPTATTSPATISTVILKRPAASITPTTSASILSSKGSHTHQTPSQHTNKRHPLRGRPMFSGRSGSPRATTSSNNQTRTAAQRQGRHGTSGDCKSPESSGPYSKLSQPSARPAQQLSSQNNGLPWQASDQEVCNILRAWGYVSLWQPETKCNIEQTSDRTPHEQTSDRTPHEQTKTGLVVIATNPLVSATEPYGQLGSSAALTKQNVNSASKCSTVLSPRLPISSASLSCHITDDTLCHVMHLSSDW